MSYLLDTCILSKLRRLAKYPDPVLQKWIERHPASFYWISVFSIAEIQAGIAKLSDTLPDQRKYKNDLKDWLANDLIPEFAGRIVDFNLQTAHRWGNLVGDCKRKGLNLPIIDSLIAATAIQHDLVVVTENVSDFEHAGTHVLNPWEEQLQ